MSSPPQRTLINDLTKGPLFRQILMFSLPIIGANLLQALYTLVDLWVVGQFAASTAISAVSVSGQIILLIQAVSIGMCSGGQVLISQQVGVKDYKQLQRTIGTLFSTCVLASVILAVVGAAGSSLWLDLMKIPAEALTEGRAYLLICCIGLPFVYSCNALCAVLRGIGDSRRPMYILGVSTATNIVLDLLFVAVFRWGAAGAAWATIIAQIISFIYAFLYLYKHRAELGFDFKPASFKIHIPLMKLILKLSAPLIVMSAAVTVSQLVVLSFINVYGVAASSITGIGTKLFSVATAVTQGTLTAASSIIAQNFAAGKIDRARRAVWLGIGIDMIFFVLVAVLALLVPTQLVGIFSPDPAVLTMAPAYMKVFVFLFLSSALMCPPMALINGVGFPTLNLVIALLDGVVARIGLSILLGNVLGWGLPGYWWGNALAGYVSVGLSFLYFFMNTWPKRKVLAEGSSEASGKS